MLRSDRQVALHDLLEALAAAAGRYADDAAALGSGEGAELCQDLGQRRAQLAALVAARLRRAGDLPTEPDADRETLNRLGDRLRALLSADQRTSILRERRAGEAALQQLAVQAAALAIEPEWQELLERIKQEAEQAQLRLQELVPPS